MSAMLEGVMRALAEWPQIQRENPWLALGAESVGLAVVFSIFRAQIVRRSRLREKDYHTASPLLAGFLYFPSLALVLLAIGPLTLAGFGQTWGAIAPTPVLRIGMLCVAATLAWGFSAYQPNPVYGRVHALERLAVLALFALMAWRPAFAAPFIYVILVVIHQFEYPIRGQYRWTDKIPVIEVVVAFAVFVAMRGALAPISPMAFLIVAFSVVASSYFYSAVTKVRLDWTASDRLSLLFAAAFDNGWLFRLGEAGMLRFARTLDRLNEPLKIATMVLELGVIIALANHWLAAAFLLGLAGMHVGIFLSSGICFWKWVVLDLALAAVTLDLWGGLSPDAAFAPLVFSALLTAAGPLLWTVKWLGWYDTPLSGVYRFDAVLADGSVREVSPRQFAPYDFPLAQGRFHYLNPKRVLVDVYGKAKTRGAYEALLGVRTLADLDAIRKPHGMPRGKKRHIPEFDALMRGFFGGYPGVLRLRRIFQKFEPPHHIWTGHVTLAAWDPSTEVKSLRVRYVETLFPGDRREVLSDEVIREVEIGKPEESTGGKAPNASPE